MVGAHFWTLVHTHGHAWCNRPQKKLQHLKWKEWLEDDLRQGAFLEGGPSGQIPGRLLTCVPITSPTYHCAQCTEHCALCTANI